MMLPISSFSSWPACQPTYFVIFLTPFPLISPSAGAEVVAGVPLLHGNVLSSKDFLNVIAHWPHAVILVFSFPFCLFFPWAANAAADVDTCWGWDLGFFLLLSPTSHFCPEPLFWSVSAPNKDHDSSYACMNGMEDSWTRWAILPCLTISVAKTRGTLHSPLSSEFSAAKIAAGR